MTMVKQIILIKKLKIQNNNIKIYYLIINNFKLNKRQYFSDNSYNYNIILFDINSNSYIER